MNKQTKRKKVVVVDDHPIVRKGLSQLINQTKDLRVCGEAGDVHEALEVIDTHKPDCVIVDLMLGLTSGITLIENIRGRWEDLPVLVLSMYDESLYAERVLRVGAQGYIMKKEASERLIDALRQVMDGEIFVSDKIKSKLLHSFSGASTKKKGLLIDSLSNRELEVFQLLGQGYSTRQIGDILHLSVKTVETYYAHIKEKMQLKDGRELLMQSIQWAQNQKL
jgi:DNA-binding NarL/FixJ family response regulator